MSVKGDGGETIKGIYVSATQILRGIQNFAHALSSDTLH